MRKVLSSLLISLALGGGADALWACGMIGNQHMTPAQIREYRFIVADAQGGGGPIPTPQEVFGNPPATNTSPTPPAGQPAPNPSSSSTPSAPTGQPAPNPSTSSTPSAPTTPPPPPVTYTTTYQSGQSSVQILSVSKHDPSSDIIVPQIDLVPDIAGDMLPDGGTVPQVM